MAVAVEIGPDGSPDGTRTPADGLVASLQEWRTAAGNPSYAEIASRVGRTRRARGRPDHESRVARTTVYDLFRLGRRRIDTELLLDVVVALDVDGQELELWERAVARFHRGETDVAVPRPEVEREPAVPTTRLFLPGARLLAPIVGRRAGALMLVCLGINLVGNTVTQFLPFMLYLDMIGTAIAAVVLGPWHGVLVGVATNVATVPQNGVESAYFIVVQVAGALVWGYGMRSGSVRTIARYLLLSCLAGVICSLVATTVILTMFEGGLSQHGSDNLVEVMLERGHSVVLAVSSTNMLTSIIDKVLSGLLALVAIDVLSTRQRDGQHDGQRG